MILLLGGVRWLGREVCGLLGKVATVAVCRSDSGYTEKESPQPEGTWGFQKSPTGGNFQGLSAGMGERGQNTRSLPKCRWNFWGMICSFFNRGTHHLIFCRLTKNTKENMKLKEETKGKKISKPIRPSHILTFLYFLPRLYAGGLTPILIIEGCPIRLKNLEVQRRTQ